MPKIQPRTYNMRSVTVAIIKEMVYKDFHLSEKSAAIEFFEKTQKLVKDNRHCITGFRLVTPEIFYNDYRQHKYKIKKTQENREEPPNLFDSSIVIRPARQTRIK